MATKKGVRLKGSFLGVLFSIMLWPLPCIAGEGDLVEQDSRLPQEISDYYDDYNFVVSYSTPLERRRIRHTRDSEALMRLPERLKKIRILLRSIDSRILSPDEGILELSRRRPYKPLPPPELTEMIKKRENGPNIMVHVRTSPLSPSDNVWMISEYEQRDMKEFPLPRLLKKRGARNIPRLEIHNWTRVSGRWMKNCVNIVFIKYQD